MGTAVHVRVGWSACRLSASYRVSALLCSPHLFVGRAAHAIGWVCPVSRSPKSYSGVWAVG